MNIKNDSSFNSIPSEFEICQFLSDWHMIFFVSLHGVTLMSDFSSRARKLKAQRNKNLPPLHLTEFSPVSAQSLCALRTSAQGSRCLDVDFWREKIRGKILDLKLQNPPSICFDGNWEELTCSDAICWRNIEINKSQNLKTTRKS